MDITTTISKTITIGTSLSKIVQYTSALPDVPEEIQSIKAEVSSLLTLLYNVKSFVEDEMFSNPHLAVLKEPRGPFNILYDAINEIIKLVGGSLKEEKSKDQALVMIMGFRKLSIEDAQWPVKRKQIQELLQKLDAQKTVISMAFNAAILYVLAKLAPWIVG